MATTRLIPMHTIKNQSVSYTVHERIDYAINGGKTLGGQLVTAYGCDPATAVNEMLLRTSTDYAPWVVVEGNDKYYARIKVLETVVNAIEDRIKEK